jgi:hypothetical protein
MKATRIFIAVLAGSFALGSAGVAEPEIRRAIPVTDEPEVRRAIAVVAQATTPDDPDPLVIDDEASPTPIPTMTYRNYPSSEEEKADATGVGRFLLFVLLVVLFGAMYLWLLPGIIASKRKHPNAGSIWLITIFLGWSLFGWIGALVWSCSSKD